MRKWSVKRSKMFPDKYVAAYFSPGKHRDLQYFDTWSEAMDYVDKQIMIFSGAYLDWQ